MTHLLAIIAIALYIGSSVLMLVQLFRSKIVGRVSFAARGLFLSAVVAHTATMGLVMRDPHMVLRANGADYFLWVSWALAVAFAFLQRRLNYPIVGAFVVPAVVLFMGSSSYLLHKDTSSVVSSTGGAGDEGGMFLSLLHAVPAMVSVVTLALALIVSIVFLIVERRLKRRKMEVLSGGGPNLQLLDRVNKVLTEVGFLAISLVVLSGGFWAVSEQKPVFSLDASVMSGIVLWVLLAFLLHIRLVLRWSPKQVSRLTVIVTAWYFTTVFVVVALSGSLTHTELWP
jgi:ABC-type transport system involved in cytochrome c biogenesis permease subunit